MPVDSAVTTIGIRKVVFDVDQVCDNLTYLYFLIPLMKGLFINNNHVKIRGMCNHQDFGTFVLLLIFVN